MASTTTLPETLDVSFLMKYTTLPKKLLDPASSPPSTPSNNLTHVYKCIERAMFAFPRISRQPFYPQISARFTEPTFKLLELGCCFGTDARKMIDDGLAASNLVVSDLHDAYWNLGKTILFSDAPNVRTVFGDFADVEGGDIVTRRVFGWSVFSCVCSSHTPCFVKASVFDVLDQHVQVFRRGRVFCLGAVLETGLSLVLGVLRLPRGCQEERRRNGFCTRGSLWRRC
ncbi:hypothetical protein BC829DRAFT_70182 [Chytridium lagenaria]|nr:hypothetical protein BC829DRAFT_70182 [Chytridium lagenaria]